MPPPRWLRSREGRPQTPAALPELVRHDLARTVRGVPQATEPGRAWLARQADPDAQPNRVLGARRLAPADVPDLPGARAAVTVNHAESPLSWLYRRGHVSDRQFSAGERLRSDYERAQLTPGITMRWEAGAGGSGRRAAPSFTLSDGAMSARDRFHAAVDAAGPGLSDVLWRVVCAGEGLNAVEHALGWPQRAGKLVLSLALDRLVLFYDGG